RSSLTSLFALSSMVLASSGCSESVSTPSAAAKQNASTPAGAPAQFVIGKAVVADASTPAEKFDYPVAAKEDQSDDYHGTKVEDPYRWLEDTDSPRTREWIAAENKLTFGYLKSIPQRDAIQRRLTQLWDYEKYGVPTARDGRYFYSRNDGLQNQSVIYV